MIALNAFIKVQCADYEDGITGVTISACNGVWAGGLMMYVNDEQLSSWISKVECYDTDYQPAVFEQGDLTGKYSYYAKISVEARKISIHFVDFHIMTDGKACEFDIRCEPDQIREFGNLLRQSFKDKCNIVWEIPRNSPFGIWFPGTHPTWS